MLQLIAEKSLFKFRDKSKDTENSTKQNAMKWERQLEQESQMAWGPMQVSWASQKM